MTALKDYLKPALAFLAVTLPILLVDAFVGRILWGWFLAPIGVAVPTFLAVAGLLTLAWAIVGREFGAPAWEIPQPPPTKDQVRDSAHRVVDRLRGAVASKRESDVLFQAEEQDPEIAEALDKAYASMLDMREKEIRAMRAQFWGRYVVRVGLSALVLGMGFLLHLVGG